MAAKNEGHFHQGGSPGDSSYLIGSRCKECGYVAFPKREVCPACIREDTMEETGLGGKGKVYSYSVVHVPLPGFPVPYILCKIELPEGPIVFSLLTGCEPREGVVDIGTEVELVIGKTTRDKEGNDITGYMFRPVKGREGE